MGECNGWMGSENGARSTCTQHALDGREWIKWWECIFCGNVSWRGSREERERGKWSMPEIGALISYIYIEITLRTTNYKSYTRIALLCGEDLQSHIYRNNGGTGHVLRRALGVLAESGCIAECSCCHMWEQQKQQECGTRQKKKKGQMWFHFHLWFCIWFFMFIWNWGRQVNLCRRI